MRYFILMFAVIIISCNNNNGAGTADDDSTSVVQSDTAQITLPSCYTLQTSNNLVLLKLETMHPTVSGQLTYEIMGKDKNDGTIEGTMSGDTLFANYNFMSEGIRSVREVAFLKKGDSLIEGFGNVKQQGDTMVFTNTDSLNFDGSMVLKETPCTYP